MASPSPDRVSRLRSTAGVFLCSAAPPASLWQSLLGVGWILRLQCRGVRTVFGTFGGGFAGIASLAGCLSIRHPQIWTFGPTLQTSAGGLTWETELFPAFGTSRRLFFRSMPGSCWLCVAVSSTSSPFCPGPRWPCFATSPRSPICARWGHPVSCSQHHCAGDPPLGGISSDSTGSAVHSGDPQCSRRLSPVLTSSEWSLNMDVFRSLMRQWPVMIDLFATSDNHRCSIYFSPYRDPLSVGTDKLLQSWDGLLAYAFPPWSILPQVLAKLRVSHRTLLTLIAPYWPQRPWFVVLLQLSVALSARPDLLFQPRSRRRYPGLHRLALHAWRLSSDSPERLVSPRL